MGWVDNATPEVEAQSDYKTIIAICTVLSAFSIVIVCSRLWIRQKNHGLAADDWLSTVSMVFALIYSIMCIVRMCIRGPHEFPHAALILTSRLPI
jgi:hypothetical protein